MNKGLLNTSWAKTLINQLIKQGVDYFCLSPGSRSTPLALAIAENQEAKKFVHLDERGTAFHALGHAKASGKPAVVIVTSGTAVGNLMPAVMEACASHVSLILLTCDRPIELRDTMANQTADHIKIFGDYVRYFFDLPSPNLHIPDHFLATTITQVVSRSQFPMKGPVQLNCPFPEPFFDEETPSPPLKMINPITTFPQWTLQEKDVEEWTEKLQNIEKGLIILGAGGSSLSVKKLAQKLGWPIFPDIISSHREHSRDEMTIPYFHHMIKTLPNLRAEGILYFGDAFVSKVLLQWIGKHKHIPIMHVANHPKRCDPLHVITHRIICSPKYFCETIEPFLPQKDSGWVMQWQKLSQAIELILHSILKEQEKLCEPEVIKILEQKANLHQGIFFGNSMPIRDADMFFFPKRSCGPIFANRGLSGIDGNIATCAGIAQHMPLIACIGDQTFLHDLNSLGQITKIQNPIHLIVINNGGGGIFSFLSIGKRKEILDAYFAAAHDTHFEHAAALFDLPYQRAETKEDLFEALSRKNSCLIEVVTNRFENLSLHQKIDEAIQECLCSSSCMVS